MASSGENMFLMMTCLRVSHSTHESSSSWLMRTFFFCFFFPTGFLALGLGLVCSPSVLFSNLA